VAFTADPVCCNQQLQQCLLQLGIPHLLQPPPTAAAIIIMAVQPASATAAIAAALAFQPAFMACYLPGEQLTAHLLQQLQQQQSWTVLRAGGGVLGLHRIWCTAYLALVTCLLISLSSRVMQRITWMRISPIHFKTSMYAFMTS
jgi:ABC-type Na+ efflux pump permease subunit